MSMCCYHLKEFKLGKKLCEQALAIDRLPEHDRKRVEANLNWHQRGLEGKTNFESANYWEMRYKNGGTSGAGSYGDLSKFKAETVNALVKKHDVESMIDHGCGDGNQAGMLEVEKYIGLDVSPQAVSTCKSKHPNKPFYTYPELPEYVKGDCGLSLDVVFHLVEDEVYNTYLKRLFDSATKLVVIYGPDIEMKSTSPHVKYRKFTEWVEENAKDWTLDEVIEQKYTYSEQDPDNTSLCDFYVYKRD